MVLKGLYILMNDFGFKRIKLFFIIFFFSMLKRKSFSRSQVIFMRVHIDLCLGNFFLLFLQNFLFNAMLLSSR